MPSIDVLVVSILALAAARGLTIGLVREAFSLAGMAAAAVAVWQLGAPTAVALGTRIGGALPPAAVYGLAVAGLACGSILAVALLGRLVRRSLQFAGLGLVDRMAGGCLGALEGAFVAAVLLAGATFALDRDHPWLAQSQAVAIFERVRTTWATGTPGWAAPRDVAAPAPRPSR